MTPDDLKKIAATERFIPGIYSYCDRWCERCPLSHRCLSYALEKHEKSGDDRGEAAGRQNLWEQLQARFALTLRMVEEEAARRGVDLDAPETAAAARAHGERLRVQSESDRPLAERGRQYAAAVDYWFDAAENLFAEKGVELETKARIGVGQPQTEAEEIQELVAVIRWYEHFIHVKLARAIGSKAEESLEQDPVIKSLMKDADGSAKIALIAMDRSLSAWTALAAHFTGASDSVLDLQLQLARLRAHTESLFPNARAFIRPGFDRDPGSDENSPA